MVRDRLVARLAYALALGAVDEEFLEGLGYGGDGDSATPSTERDRDRVRERLQERLREQTERWLVIEPEWREAMEQMRERLRECRVEPSDTCVEQNRLEMQYRHAEQVSENLERRVDEALNDDALINEMERQRERAQLRLETMLQNGDAELLEGLGVQAREMEQVRDRLEQETQQQTQSTTASTDSSSSTSQQRQGQP